MSRFWKASAVALLALLTLTPVASAQRRRTVIVGGGGFYGPVWWGPGWYGPWWGPAYAPYPLTGNVKIVTHDKSDSVYVDGGYVGVTRKVKKFPLRPGNHDIALRDPRGHTFFQERVYVIAGKTIDIRPDYPG
jgi:PEGA domain-containing protein